MDGINYYWSAELVPEPSKSIVCAVYVDKNDTSFNNITFAVGRLFDSFFYKLTLSFYLFSFPYLIALEKLSIVLILNFLPSQIVLPESPFGIRSDKDTSGMGTWLHPTPFSLLSFPSHQRIVVSGLVKRDKSASSSILMIKSEWSKTKTVDHHRKLV